MVEGFVLLRGNHKDYLLTDNLAFSQWMEWSRAQSNNQEFQTARCSNGRCPTFLQRKCQLFWHDEIIQAVHAGIKADPIETNDMSTLIHDHDVILQNQYSCPLTVVGHSTLDFPTWFKGERKTKELLPPGEGLPFPKQGVICIDTGCGKGGRVTAMVIEDVWYQMESV